MQPTQVNSENATPPAAQVSSAQQGQPSAPGAPGDGTQQVPINNPTQAPATAASGPGTLGVETFDFVQGTGLSEQDARALIAELQKNQPAQPVETQVAVVTPPVVQQTQTQAAPAVVETQQPVVDTATQQQQQQSALPPKLRVPTGSDPVAVQALNIFSIRQTEGRPISLAEADALARQVLGITATAPPAAATAAEPVTTPVATTAAPATPTTVAEIDARVASITQEIASANDMMGAGYDPSKVADLQKQLFDLAVAKAEAKLTQTQEATADRDFQAQWQEGMNRAITQWPELADPHGALHGYAAFLQESALKDPGHPDHAAAHSADSAYIFAEKAAAVIKPAAPVQQQQPVSTPNAPAHAAPPLAGIFGGGSYASPSAPQPGADLATTTANWSAAEWAALSHAAGVPRIL